MEGGVKIMERIEERLKSTLEIVLTRLSQKEGFQNFFLKPYRNEFDQSSLEYPDFKVLYYAGVFITIIKGGQKYYVDFSAVDQGNSSWECQERREIDLPEEPEGLITMPEPEIWVKEEYVLPAQRIYEKQIGERVKRICDRYARYLASEDVKELLPLLKRLGVDIEEQYEEYFGGMSIRRREALSGLEAVRDIKSDLEKDRQYKEEEIPASVRFFLKPSRLRVILRGLKIGRFFLQKYYGLLKTFRIKSSKIRKSIDKIEAAIDELQWMIEGLEEELADLRNLDLTPEEMEEDLYRTAGEGLVTRIEESIRKGEFEKEIYTRYLCIIIKDAPEIRKLIVEDIISEALQEKCFEAVEEEDREARRVDKKIKPYLQFLQRELSL